MIDTDALERIYTRVNSMRNDIKSTIDHTKTIVEQEATSLKQTEKSLQQIDQAFVMLNAISNLIERNINMMMKIEGQNDNNADRIANICERLIDRMDKVNTHSQKMSHDTERISLLQRWFQVLCLIFTFLVFSQIGFLVWMVKR